MTTHTSPSTDDETPPLLTDGGEDVPYDPITFYLLSETKRDLKRWLMTLALDNDVVMNSKRYQHYEAIAQVAMEHEDEVLSYIEQLTEEA
jgi:hypothetical protein